VLRKRVLVHLDLLVGRLDVGRLKRRLADEHRIANTQWMDCT
jgi:hypothetical protein